VPEATQLHCASRQNRMRDLRFGSLADIMTSSRNVRFTPKSGHQDVISQALISFFRTVSSISLPSASSIQASVPMLRRYWTSPNACFGPSEFIFARPLGPSALTIILTVQATHLLSPVPKERFWVADRAHRIFREVNQITESCSSLRPLHA